MACSEQKMVTMCSRDKMVHHVVKEINPYSEDKMVTMTVVKRQDGYQVVMRQDNSPCSEEKMVTTW